MYETMAKIGYSVEDPGTSSQSEGYSSKWLVCREPLILMYALKLISTRGEPWFVYTKEEYRYQMM